ncbi:unnamed protein product (macronuclear) [Paramecium tetraurelia]|uniref:Phosphodiesterase n=1 Tax=Paramecium tetraurelia TaxID=5888 RepID=A0E1V7_PARTE|nr:uncharacterized protein GSPATT00022445001 [Paramecium tetraurelia]CAK89274.1 unnamed protein product [Paramecium tetraurelia]|eukprot:XP_001456671.1 hypothetical protein (macronuclear) [Paramecium tetraurelia strain d4-2]
MVLTSLFKYAAYDVCDLLPIACFGFFAFALQISTVLFINQQMKQEDSESPSLCGYINFFQVLGDMESEGLITQQEKRIIKQKLTIKEPSLMLLLSKQQEETQIKSELLSLLSSFQMTRSKSHTQEFSSSKKQGQQFQTQTIQLMDQLIIQLKCMQQYANQQVIESSLLLHQITQDFKSKIEQLRNILDSLDQDEDVDQSYVELLQSNYQQIKQRYSRYMNSLLELMDEKVEPKDIQAFLNTFLNQLIGCQTYSFILLKDQKVQIHQEDKFEEFQITKDVLDDLVNLQQITEVHSLNTLKQYYQSPNNFILKLTDYQYFVMQLDPNFMSFVMLSKKYNYMDSLIELAQFVIYTSQQIKVQYFSILSIGDTVLEFGLEIVRCSKYLLIENILQTINKQYQIHEIFENQPNVITLKFKDSSSQHLFASNLDLKKQQDLLIYNTVNQIYQRYQQFIKQCYERMQFYKYFLRSKNLFMIDFDKQGRLRFLSRALSQKIKMQFHIEKIQIDSTYKQIFIQNQQMLQNIENYISNAKWKLTQQEEDQNKPYEIFIRKEEKHFKGFTLILLENEWVRKKTQPPTNGKTIKQQLLQTETLDYIKKLEEFNPDIRNSVVAMYMPQIQECNSNAQQTQKTPTLVFRKIDKGQVVGKNSFFFKQREEERRFMKTNPNKFNESHLTLREEDSQLDSLDFNIHLVIFITSIQIKSTVEKQRIVWSMLERNNFNQMFALPQDKLINFLIEMESQYNMNNNPYHNFDHGVAVMQAVNCFIKSLTNQLDQQFFNNITKFCLLLSALCHDVAHTGKTNAYEANSISQLAIRYHDKVILEQHHAATTIKILRDDQTNILCNFSDQDFRTFRKQLISNILSTDMQEHFKMLKEFESRIEQYGNDPEDLSLLCGMITHAADFNGTARKWPQSRLWSDKINQEYRAQYAEEGKKGYPQQPFMKDLDKLHVMSKNEIGFIKVIVRPLYHQMNQFGKGAFQVCVDNLDETTFEWEKVYQQELKAQQQQGNQ